MSIHVNEKLIKRPQDDLPLTKSQAEEWVKCAEDKDYFFKTYVYIQGENGRELFNARDYQWEIIDAANENRFTVNLAGRQCGKALALDTIVPTPTGYTTMGELKPGDTVYGDDGKPVLVSHASSVMEEHDCYRIEFNCHRHLDLFEGEKITNTVEKVVADADHVWYVYDNSDNQFKLMTTEQMFNERSQYVICGPVNGTAAISSIEKVKSVPVRCIMVDNESHLFCVTRSFIPTHNTTTFGADVLHDTVFTEDYPV